MTTGFSEEGIPSPETRISEQMLEHRGAKQLYYRGYGLYFAEAEHFKNLIDWDKTLSEVTKMPRTVWDTTKMKKFLADPLGAPIELTREEADEIVRLAYARRPDLPPGKELVEEIRELLGHSLIERLKKVE